VSVTTTRAHSGVKHLADYSSIKQDDSTGAVSLAGVLRSEWTVAFALFAIFFLVRLPFLSQYPVNWDAVQYVLGVESFDLSRHQPHPPGYIGYIAFGHIFSFLFGDPHRGLVMLSVVSGAFATVAMYALARCWLDRRFSIITAVLFGASPVVWYYSLVALNYILEAALVIPIAWLLYRARRDKRWSDLLLATLVLALLGAVRQSGMVLMVPLWIYTAWAFPWRERIITALVMGSSILAWLIPLLMLSGGVRNYWRESRALADLVSVQTTLYENFQERVGYLAFVLIALTLALMAAIPLYLLFKKRAGAVVRAMPNHDRIFFVLWIIPALATYVVGHMGQIGYVLTILPVAVLWLGATLSRVPQHANGLRYVLPTLLAAIVVLANMVVFAVAPSTALVVAGNLGNGDTPRSVQAMRQYDIRTSNAYWDDVVTTMKLLPAESTAVLATIGGPRIHGGYRHLSYYLPEYDVYGLGYDRRGFFGHLFTTRNGETNYSVFRLAAAHPILIFSDEIRYIVTSDREIIERLPESLSTVEFNDGKIVVIQRPAGMNLVFVPGDQLAACYCVDLRPEMGIRTADPPLW
jgi:hypothetical protein